MLQVLINAKSTMDKMMEMARKQIFIRSAMETQPQPRMRAIDLLIATLRAVTLANIFVCFYKAYRLVSEIEIITDEANELITARIDQMERASVDLFRVLVPNAQIQRHQPMVAPNELQKQKRLSGFCKNCIRQAEQQDPNDREFKISDVCWVILVNRAKNSDKWLDEFFEADGRLKNYDSRKDTSKELHSLIGGIKEIIRRTKILA